MPKDWPSSLPETIAKDVAEFESQLRGRLRSQPLTYPVPGPLQQTKGKSATMTIFDDFVNARRPNKFAPVAPARIYREMMVAGFIPENVLLLAHDVAQNTMEYDYVFSLPCWDNTNIIMDNSVVETGGAVDADMVELAIRTVDADVVVLPDVLGDGAKSREATHRAWESWYWRFREVDKMIVLQGSDEHDWLISAEDMRQYSPEWISVPRIVETGKWERTHYLKYCDVLYPETKVHLLGFSDYVMADLIAAAQPNVVSIDSAVPLRYTGSNLFSDEILGRGDWWAQCVLDDGMIERCLEIDTYIKRLA